MDKEKIKRALEEKGATKECHRCGNTSFLLAEGYSYFPINDETGQVILGGPNMPVVLTICSKCGAVTPHALGIIDKSSLSNNENEHKDK